MSVVTKDARIEFKTSSEIKELLQNAAHTLGMDLSSFLISVSTQRARDIMYEEQLLTLSSKEWEKLETYRAQENRPTQALKDLMSMKCFDA